MEINWKLGTVCAAAAFLFSVFFGILGGVQFSTLILRAFAGGVVFGILGIGAFLIVKSFLPELLRTEEKGESWGGEIDIVIPDHNPHERQADEETETADSMEETDFDSLVEEVEESSESPAVPVINAEAGRLDSADGELADEVDALPEMGGFPDTIGDGASSAAGFDGKSAGEKNVSNSGNPEMLARVVQTILKREKEG